MVELRGLVSSMNLCGGSDFNVDVHSNIGQHCDEMFDLKPINIPGKQFCYPIGGGFELLGGLFGCPLARSNQLTQVDHEIGANSQVLRFFWSKT
jgi:hypothetical protein